MTNLMAEAETKSLKARTPADLLDKIYAAEGWKRAAGEVRSRRAAAVYDLGRDNKRGFYTATRKPAAAIAKAEEAQ